MDEYSSDFFFWFKLVTFLLFIPFAYAFYQPYTKYCVQIDYASIKQAPTMCFRKCKMLKLDYPVVVFKSLDSVHC